MVDVVALVIPKENGRPPSLGEVRWRKRQAVQIAAQLPEDKEAALAVLEYARSLVLDFLDKD